VKTRGLLQRRMGRLLNIKTLASSHLHCLSFLLLLGSANVMNRLVQNGGQHTVPLGASRSRPSRETVEIAANIRKVSSSSNETVLTRPVRPAPHELVFCKRIPPFSSQKLHRKLRKLTLEVTSLYYSEGGVFSKIVI
jgi:hypothetical protein